MGSHWFKSVCRIPFFMLASPIYLLILIIIFEKWVSTDGLTWKGAIKQWKSEQ